MFSLFFLLILASQLWCLGCLLPLLIGDLVPDDDPYWDNYLLLLTIVDYVFAPTLSKRTPAFLTVLINDHLSQFKEIIPTAPSFKSNITSFTFLSGLSSKLMRNNY